MEAFVEQFVLKELDFYGPFAVLLLLLLTGIGLPIGEDVITIPAGILIGHGELDFHTTAVCAYVGVVAADFMWFGLCSRYGTPLVHRRWFKRFLHPRRLLEARHEIERRGVWVIIMARFIPGSRTAAITMAGILHMPLRKFALADCTCVLVSVPMQLGLGMLIAKGVGTGDTARLVPALLGTVVAILLSLLLLGWLRRYRAGRARLPRAKAVWLRSFRPARRRPPESVRPDRSAPGPAEPRRRAPVAAATLRSPKQRQPTRVG